MIGYHTRINLVKTTFRSNISRELVKVGTQDPDFAETANVCVLRPSKYAYFYRFIKLHALLLGTSRLQNFSICNFFYFSYYLHYVNKDGCNMYYAYNLCQDITLYMANTQTQFNI